MTKNYLGYYLFPICFWCYFQLNANPNSLNCMISEITLPSYTCLSEQEYRLIVNVEVEITGNLDSDYGIAVSVNNGEYSGSINGLTSAGTYGIEVDITTDDMLRTMPVEASLFGACPHSFNGPQFTETSNCTIEQGSREQDSLVLVALHNSANGANWTESWNFDLPMDEWSGIRLNETGRVICIDLDGVPDCSNTTSSDGNNLIGSLPVNIASLSELEELHLANNKIAGEIPFKLTLLANLKELSLRSNELTGAILPLIGDLTNLEVLDLARNQLTGSIPIEIGSLINLDGLDLSRNQLDGIIPSQIGALTKLRFLDL